MNKACEKEIVDLHQFFEDWMTGRLPQTDETFARVGASMAKGFTIVGPNGRLTHRINLLPNLFAAYGSRPNFRIWIEKFAVHQKQEGLALVTYEEWQEIDGETTSRLSSALFREDASTPNGVRWLHVHETWFV